VSWRVKIGRDAKKELARLPATAQRRVARVLLTLETSPFPPGCKKLKNRDGWRLRVGDYRVLYFANKAAREIVIGVVAHRKDVYRK
jgi:mRNA interferase RelE/StbE